MNGSTERFGRIGVLNGGISSEREISLKSGKAITEALLRRGCDVIALDITDGAPEAILSLLKGADVDLAFIALHGQLGEDGTIQSILERAGIPYTGSGVEASRLAINKALAQDLFKNNGVNACDDSNSSTGSCVPFIWLRKYLENKTIGSNNVIKEVIRRMVKPIPVSFWAKECLA